MAKIGLRLFTVLLAAFSAAPATAQRADVIHFYTSSGESLPSACLPRNTQSAAASGWTILLLAHRRSRRWR